MQEMRDKSFDGFDEFLWTSKTKDEGAILQKLCLEMTVATRLCESQAIYTFTRDGSTRSNFNYFKFISEAFGKTVKDPKAYLLNLKQ